MNKKVGIIGFGRFGKTLYRLIKDDFDIVLYDKSSRAFENSKLSKNTKISRSAREIYSCGVVFYAIPIEEFEDTIKKHQKFFHEQLLLVDVLSVKMHPKKVFEKYLSKLKTQALLTHPMFGPDSSKNGFKDLPVILDKFKTDEDNYNFWKSYFIKKDLKVVEMTAKQHDKIAANTQGLTHFVGRLLDAYGFKPSKIDSLGTKKLLEVMDQTVNDTWQLFTNLQLYNPYTKPMRIKLGTSYDKLYNKLVPDHATKGVLTAGIQGGVGSFNEEAIMYYFKRYGTIKFKISYLYTSEAVLNALHRGDVDIGQFAIHNSIGGVVTESINALARYKISIVEQFAIKIAHALMIRSDAELKDIDMIMSHPQVFAQCKLTLEEKYPKLKLISGKGKLIDHALVAKKLSEKKLPKNVATMGSKILAKKYNLKIVEDNLQDSTENFTSFLVVKRFQA